jgi:hypothetical protein
MSKTSVEKLFDEMDSDEQHQVILSFMQYPRTAKLDKHDTPILCTTYSCNKVACDFSEAKKAIKESVELRAYGAQPFLEKVINLLDDPCYMKN